MGSSARRRSRYSCGRSRKVGSSALSWVPVGKGCLSDMMASSGLAILAACEELSKMDRGIILAYHGAYATAVLDLALAAGGAGTGAASRHRQSRRPTRDSGVPAAPDGVRLITQYRRARRRLRLCEAKRLIAAHRDRNGGSERRRVPVPGGVCRDREQPGAARLP